MAKKIQYRASEQRQNEFLFQVQKSDNDLLKSSEIDGLKQSDSDRFHEEQKIEQKNNVVDFCKKNMENQEKITDAQILAEYAKEHGATNIQGYVNALRIKGVAAEIIRQYREKEGVQKYWESQAASTSELIKSFDKLAEYAEPPSESFKAIGEKLRKMRIAFE